MFPSAIGRRAHRQIRRPPRTPMRSWKTQRPIVRMGPSDPRIAGSRTRKIHANFIPVQRSFGIKARTSPQDPMRRATNGARPAPQQGHGDSSLRGSWNRLHNGCPQMVQLTRMTQIAPSGEGSARTACGPSVTSAPSVDRISDPCTILGSWIKTRQTRAPQKMVKRGTPAEVPQATFRWLRACS